MKKPNAGEETLALHLRASGIEFVREYRFGAEHVGLGPRLRERLKAAGLQDWRADFALPELKLLIEVEGGAWLSKSRHTTGAGFSADLAKYDSAMRLGFNVYRVSPEMVKQGRAIDTIKQLVELSRAKLSATTSA